MKREEDFVQYINGLKEKLDSDSHEYEKKLRSLINETHNAYEAGYVELQSTIKCLRKNNQATLQLLSTAIAEATKEMNAPRKILDEIL